MYALNKHVSGDVYVKVINCNTKILYLAIKTDFCSARSSLRPSVKFVQFYVLLVQMRPN
jgi:hypothetical protein